LRTFSLLKDLPVYEPSGSIIGRVADLCIDDHGAVAGLLMDGKGLFQRDRFVPISCITSFGRDGVIVNGKVALKPVPKDIDAHFLYSHHGLYRKPILTSEGEKLGLLEDVYFLEEMGTIIGYEVTDGFFADITEGKKVVKTDKPITVGEDVIFINVKP